MNYKDADGFVLQFEGNVPDEERKYYMKTFPRVSDISKLRVHCTSCNQHIGTAPTSQINIHTHSLLGVTQCDGCFKFYVSFSK